MAWVVAASAPGGAMPSAVSQISTWWGSSSRWTSVPPAPSIVDCWSTVASCMTSMPPAVSSLRRVVGSVSGRKRTVSTIGLPRGLAQ